MDVWLFLTLPLARVQPLNAHDYCTARPVARRQSRGSISAKDLGAFAMGAFFNSEVFFFFSTRASVFPASQDQELFLEAYPSTQISTAFVRSSVKRGCLFRQLGTSAGRTIRRRHFKVLDTFYHFSCGGVMGPPSFLWFAFHKLLLPREPCVEACAQEESPTRNAFVGAIVLLWRSSCARLYVLVWVRSTSVGLGLP